MLRGRSGAISSVIQVARSAPRERASRMSCEIISEVVEVKTKRLTFEPDATDASRRLSVPWTLVATNSERVWVSMFGL